MSFWGGKLFVPPCPFAGVMPIRKLQLKTFIRFPGKGKISEVLHLPCTARDGMTTTWTTADNLLVASLLCLRTQVKAQNA